MRQRSETWKRLAVRGNFRMESVAIINGVEYTAISAPIINRALLADNLSVGNCISSTLKLSVLTDDVLGKAAQVVIKARITDDVEYSEWLEFGTFYIDNRSIDSGLVTVQCYDSMLKASQMYTDDTNAEDRIGWPKSMRDCVNEIAARIGVEVDSRTVIKTTEPYQVPYPSKLSMVQVLGYIGACHGGNWIITQENKLRLVPLLAPPAETFNVIDHDYNPIYTGDGHKLVWQHTDTGETIEHKAGGGLINVPVVVGKIATSKPFKVSRVIISRDEDLGYTLGDDSGYTLIIESNPYACQAICDDLFSDLGGLDYHPYTITSACYDPATELGDWIIVGDQVRSVLYSENATLNIDFRTNISAPGKDEVGSEYPYLTSIQRLQQETEQLKKYTETEKDEIYSKIEQTHTDILIAVAGTYATKASVNSSIALTEQKITSEVSRATGEEARLSSLITQTAEQVSLKVSKGDVSSQISVESGAVSIGSNRLTIESDNFKLSGTGEVMATGTLSTEGEKCTASLKSGELTFECDSTDALVLRSPNYGSNAMGYLCANTEYGFAIVTNNADSYSDLCYLANNGKAGDTFVDEEVYFSAKNIFYNGVHCYDSDFEVDEQIIFHTSKYHDWDLGGWATVRAAEMSGQLSPGLLVDGAFLDVTGDLMCDGQKYRAVDTVNYGRVGMNAMESATAVFSDIGSGTIDDTGVAYIYFEPVYAETIDNVHDYQVFVSAANCTSLERVEKHPGYFVIHGDPGTLFDWIIFARQKDYATHRLESLPMVKQDNIKVDNSIFYGDNTAAAQSESLMAGFTDTYDEQAEAYLKQYEQEVTNYGN